MKALLFALILSVSALCQAHEDQPIQRAEDGTLLGLPSAYAPARLQLVFSQVDEERRLTAALVQLGKSQLQLPTCLLGLIRTQGPEGVRLSASWDHDETVLPPYLALRFLDPGSPAAGFTLLLQLRSARLMEMSVDIARGPDDLESIAVDLHSRCAADELQGVLASQ